MEQTKIIDVFNKETRKIKCIANEYDYLGDGTIFKEDKLVVGELYTLIEASRESYGAVVYIKEVPTSMGIQASLFEELEVYDKKELMMKSEKWLYEQLEASERDVENGNTIPAEVVREELRKQIHEFDYKERKKRNQKRIKPFLEELEKLWEKYPDLRFGQIVSHIESDDTKMFYLEDDKIVERMKELNNK